jgi:hypothetical protein
LIKLTTPRKKQKAERKKKVKTKETQQYSIPTNKKIIKNINKEDNGKRKKHKKSDKTKNN